MTSFTGRGPGSTGGTRFPAAGPLAGLGDRDIQDPAESWERPIASAAAARIGLHGSRLRLSPTDQEMPPGGQRALRACCGSLAPDHLVLAAPFARPIDRQRRRCVAGTAALLGFGDRGTGLWVQGYERGVAVTVPHERIGFLEDVRLLGYRRLALRSADARLAVRYDPATRAAVEAALAELRLRATGEDREPLPWSGARAVDDVEPDERARVVLEHLLVDAGEQDAAALIGRWRGDVGAGAARLLAVVLTARELILAAETESDAGQGVGALDLVVAPRRRLQRITLAEGGLALRSASADRIVRIGAALARATADLVASTELRPAATPA